jgi:DNA primase
MNNLNLQKETSKFSEILSSKGISDKVARMFEIGLLVNDHVVGYFNYDIPNKFIGSTGLIFPIKDLYGGVVSFYLRKSKKDPSKYDSLPFKKDLLFGLHKTFPFIYKHGAILVEGPFDVFVLLSYGIFNVCALLGTNINSFQMCLLRRFTDKCFILLDGDPIGRTKSTEITFKLKEFGFICKTVYLPQGYDPDTYVKTFGKDKLYEILFSA